jgi:hypothetical protein
MATQWCVPTRLLALIVVGLAVFFPNPSFQENHWFQRNLGPKRRGYRTHTMPSPCSITGKHLLKLGGYPGLSGRKNKKRKSLACSPR